MDYKTVFEITDKGFEIITLMPLLFGIIGVGISWFNIKYNKSTSPKRMFTIVFGFIFSGFALIMLLFTVTSVITNRNKTIHTGDERIKENASVVQLSKSRRDEILLNLRRSSS